MNKVIHNAIMRSETDKQIRLIRYPDKEINLKAQRELLCFINVRNKKNSIMVRTMLIA